MTTPLAQVIHGDCLDAMRELPDDSVDAICTDPPYGLGFMGKAWDDLPPGIEWAAECLRVLKPGGHMLAFGGTRTWHRLACAVEDAGFEIRDSIAWLYGSGFPKSLDVSKAIDKDAGAEREVVGRKPVGWGGLHNNANLNDDGWNKVGTQYPEGQPITAPATPEAARWQGWGTALKPAFEPVVVARKPLVGTVAANVTAHGTGALNIDGCRIEGTYDPAGRKAQDNRGGRYVGGPALRVNDELQTCNPAGRWPANVVLDESQAAALDEQSGTVRSAGLHPTTYSDSGGYGGALGLGVQGPLYNDKGGASRFYYVAKAPKSERPVVDGVAHATVKPLTLMRWLVRLVTPPGGTVLEPFAGSGTTIEAALLEGFDVIGIEREADYLPLIEARIARVEAARPVAPAHEQDAFDFEQPA